MIAVYREDDRVWITNNKAQLEEIAAEDIAGQKARIKAVHYSMHNPTYTVGTAVRTAKIRQTDIVGMVWDKER